MFGNLLHVQCIRAQQQEESVVECQVEQVLKMIKDLHFYKTNYKDMIDRYDEVVNYLECNGEWDILEDFNDIMQEER